jgi:hypothetical protein
VVLKGQPWELMNVQTEKGTLVAQENYDMPNLIDSFCIYLGPSFQVSNSVALTVWQICIRIIALFQGGGLITLR